MNLSEEQRLWIAKDFPVETPGTFHDVEREALISAIDAGHVFGTATMLVQKHVAAALNDANKKLAEALDS